MATNIGHVQKLFFQPAGMYSLTGGDYFTVLALESLTVFAPQFGG